MKNFDNIIFGKKTFSDILKDIYDNSKKTEKQISELISSLSPMIKSAGEAVIIVPLIKEYMEVKVKNDEHLVKMAAVIQRALSSADSNDGEILLTDSEKEDLLKEVNRMSERKLIEIKVDNENKGESIATNKY